MYFFVHAQAIKTVHAGGGVKKWQNSVHVVVEWPLVAQTVGRQMFDLAHPLDWDKEN